jgi:TonB family protein
MHSKNPGHATTRAATAHAGLALAALAILGASGLAIADSGSAAPAAHADPQQLALSRATLAIRQGDLESARRLLDEAAANGTSDGLTSARAQYRAALDNAQAHETAARVASAAALAARAHGEGAVAEADPILHPRPVKPLQYELPPSLRVWGRSGYVTVEFMLDGSGRASRLHVVEAHPAGVFDDVALDAVRRGTFDTATLGDDRQPRRAQLRLAFRN